jgi:hypothetical protein
MDSIYYRAVCGDGKVLVSAQASEVCSEVRSKSWGYIADV